MTEHEPAPQPSEPSGSQVIAFPTASLPTAAPNEELLSALYGRYAAKLTEYASQYVSRDEADDFVQRAFVDLWNRHLSDARQSRPRADYDALLFQSVRFLIMDYRRPARRRLHERLLGRYAGALQGMARRWMEPQAAVEADDFNKAINTALQAMSPRTREVQALYRKAGFSVDEIVATTGMARTSVRTLIQRGNRILRDHLDRAGYSPESRRSDSGRSFKS